MNFYFVLPLEVDIFWVWVYCLTSWMSEWWLVYSLQRRLWRSNERRDLIPKELSMPASLYEYVFLFTRRALKEYKPIIIICGDKQSAQLHAFCSNLQSVFYNLSRVIADVGIYTLLLSLAPMPGPHFVKNSAVHICKLPFVRVWWFPCVSSACALILLVSQTSPQKMVTCCQIGGEGTDLKCLTNYLVFKNVT